MGRFASSSLHYKTTKRSKSADKDDYDETPRAVASRQSPPSPDGASQSIHHKRSASPLEVVGVDILTASNLGKPCKPYCKIIAFGIATSPSKMMSLNDIYAFFAKHFTGFKNTEATGGWKNTIRHNLSHQKYFVKSNVSSPEPGKGNMWMFDPVAAVQEGFVIDLTPTEQRELAEQNRLHLTPSRVFRKSKTNSSDLTVTSSSPKLSPTLPSPHVESPVTPLEQSPTSTVAKSEFKSEDQVVSQFMEEFLGVKPEPVDVLPADSLDHLMVTTQAPATTSADDFFNLLVNMNDIAPMKPDVLPESVRPADPLKPILTKPAIKTPGYGVGYSVAPTTGKTYYLPSNLVTAPTPVTVSSVAPIPAHFTTFDLLHSLISPTTNISQQLDLLSLRQQQHMSEVSLLEHLLSTNMPSLPLINSPESPTTVAPFQLHVSTSITASPILMSPPPLSSDGSLKRKRRASR